MSGTASGNRLQYTGLPNDGTGLQYNRARYYDPSLQRFISPDPLGFGGGSLNLYSYVGNSPTNGTDPSGLLAPAQGIFGAGAPALGGRKTTASDELGGLNLGAGGGSGESGGGDWTPPGSDNSSGGGGLFSRFVNWARGLFDGSSPTTEPPPVAGGSGESPGGGRPRDISGGEATPEQVLQGAEDWLGPGYREIAPGVYRSADNLRQFRMTAGDLTDIRQGVHVHFESVAANGRTIIENSHVTVFGP